MNAELKFEDISFEEQKDKLVINFLKIFQTEIEKSKLEKIGNFKIEDNKIIFSNSSKETAERKFNRILAASFENLKNKLSGKKAIYIHKNSGIPLIGNLEFGIVDRNTSLIELRPMTSCNLDCVFCSVDESKRCVDFVVEKDYLVEEFKKLVEFKQCDNIEAHIGTQGEPLLYEPLADLVRDLRKLKQVKKFSINTNATLLTKKKADELIDAGLTNFNISLNAIDENIAKKMANKSSYSVKNILEIAEYVAKKGANVRLSPVWVNTMNDKEIEKIILFAKKIGAKLGIQNFLEYKFGKKPAKQLDFEEFFKRLKGLEKKHNAKLILSSDDFNIQYTKKLPKPADKGDIIKAEIKFPGRLKKEMIGVFDNRTITLTNCTKSIGATVKARILRSKHNIFMGICI